jgi:TldD protein
MPPTKQPQHQALPTMTLALSVSPDAVPLWPPPGSRRAWLMGNAALLIATRTPWHRRVGVCTGARRIPDRLARQALRQDLAPWQALAHWAMDAAQHAGAAYADVRLTRTIVHRYGFNGVNLPAIPVDQEMVGIGVRVLVNGYWGFVACPTGEVLAPTDAVVQLAQAAVAQARANATGGTPRTVDMGHYPAVTGTWATPVAIDPFIISIEEKGHYIAYWWDWAMRHNVNIDPLPSKLIFMRQEKMVATSEGTLVTQTRYESGGTITVQGVFDTGVSLPTELNLEGLETTGKGWELFATEARIPEQLVGMRERLAAAYAEQRRARPFTLGRYTLVCDGATMATLVGQTLGVATQLDRALGYEADAGGTSFLDDPLAMVGHDPVASPHVTVTANRSAPAQLATIQWDDEGVAPQPFTLIQDGMLVDFQTTREQAAWLAPYYQAQGRVGQSHGCATAVEALEFPLQQRPNLTLVPNAKAVTMVDLVADVTEGILIEGGTIWEVDFQARTGFLTGTLHKITNGRVGPLLTGGAVLFDAVDLFKHVGAVGGATTAAVVSRSPYAMDFSYGAELMSGHWKGQPPQFTSYSVSGVAATIPNQPIIDPSRKA